MESAMSVRQPPRDPGATRDRVGIYVDEPNLYDGTRSLIGDGRLMTDAQTESLWSRGLRDAHNLARWTARLGLGEGIVTTRTLRRRYFSLAGRLTHSARRWTLHLPRRWPWSSQLAAALARLRALPLPA